MPERIEYYVQDAPEALQALGYTKIVKQDDAVIGAFATYEDANHFRCEKSATDDDRISLAKSIIRAGYYSEVREYASSIQDELNDRIKDGEYGETLRNWLMEHIEETVDGSQIVIYTSQAHDCVMNSDNDGAYFQEFGDEGAVEDGEINWSRLAYSAFRQDVMEQLESLGVNVNSPVPDCDECESDDQDERRYVDGDRVICETCHDEAEKATDKEDADRVE